MDDRYLYRGKRLDNGEIIQGSLIDRRRWYGVCEIEICNEEIEKDCYERFEVDPATVEPVAVRVEKGKTTSMIDILTKKTEYFTDQHCPNCHKKIANLEADKNMPDTIFEYCQYCGQRLDWSVDNG